MASDKAKDASVTKSLENSAFVSDMDDSNKESVESRHSGKKSSDQEASGSRKRSSSKASDPSRVKSSKKSGDSDRIDREYSRSRSRSSSRHRLDYDRYPWLFS